MSAVELQQKKSLHGNLNQDFVEDLGDSRFIIVNKTKDTAIKRINDVAIFDVVGFISASSSVGYREVSRTSKAVNFKIQKSISRPIYRRRSEAYKLILDKNYFYPEKEETASIFEPSTKLAQYVIKGINDARQDVGVIEGNSEEIIVNVEDAKTIILEHVMGLFSSIAFGLQDDDREYLELTNSRGILRDGIGRALFEDTLPISVEDFSSFLLDLTQELMKVARTGLYEGSWGLLLLIKGKLCLKLPEKIMPEKESWEKAIPFKLEI